MIEPAVDKFEAPNQEKARREARKRNLAASNRRREDANADWTAFVSELNRNQKLALTRALKRPDKFVESFESTLDPKQRARLHSILVQTRDPVREDRWVRFDSKLAASWIFSRVLGLGWSPAKFARFDERVGYGGSRQTHRAERIGKKYQWIAFHELIGRIADHCAYHTDWGYGEAADFDGPWELWLRDIDPSMLVRSQSGDSDLQTHPVWWAKVGPQLPVGGPERRVEWLSQASDLPDPKALIEVDRTGEPWLTLEGYYQWEEPVAPEEKPWDKDRCHLWYQIRSYFVPIAELPHFLGWAEAQNWMGRWMPESLDVQNVFLGEYPWHPSAREARQDWVTEARGVSDGLPTPVMVSAASLAKGSNGFDTSANDVRYGLVPSGPLLSWLGARWQGSGYSYVASDGRLVAFDPGAEDGGPRALLVEPSSLWDVCTSNGLALVWTVLGEKQIYGHSMRIGAHPGWLEIYGALAWENAEIVPLSFQTNFVRHAREV